MLTATAMELSTGRLAETSLNNAVLESFTVHARVVLDVFYPPNKVFDDDVLAEDFLPDGVDWSTVRPPLTDALSLAKRRTGKEIAHLTYARLEVTADDKPWPFIQIKTDLEAVVRAFTAAVPPANLGDMWR